MCQREYYAFYVCSYFSGTGFCCEPSHYPLQHFARVPHIVHAYTFLHSAEEWQTLLRQSSLFGWRQLSRTHSVTQVHTGCIPGQRRIHTSIYIWYMYDSFACFKNLGANRFPLAPVNTTTHTYAERSICKVCLSYACARAAQNDLWRVQPATHAAPAPKGHQHTRTLASCGRGAASVLDESTSGTSAAAGGSVVVLSPGHRECVCSCGREARVFPT